MDPCEDIYKNALQNFNVPLNYQQDDNEEEYENLSDSEKPRILLLGLKRSGKSSIQNVVFNKMTPGETTHLESTVKVVKSDFSTGSFVQFQVWDFPGQVNFFDTNFDYEEIFGNCGAVVFVIDSQDDLTLAINKLVQTVKKAYEINPGLYFEVFIHKVDGLTQEQRIDVQNEINDKVREDLYELVNDISICFHQTSIYDHSIFESFSKVVQKLIDELPVLESLLNVLCASSGIENAFLFDVVTKIYIATDSFPIEAEVFQLCTDIIDVTLDVSCIYGLEVNSSGTAYDSGSKAIVGLSNNTFLFLREVNKYLALVCMVRDKSFAEQGLIDFNFQCFKRAIHQVFKAKANFTKFESEEREK